MGHEKMVVWAFGVAVAWELFTYLTTTLLYLSLKCQMVSLLHKLSNYQKADDKIVACLLSPGYTILRIQRQRCYT